jgi:hypothetical protein
MPGEILTPLNIHFLGTTKSEPTNANSEPKQKVVTFSYLRVKKFWEQQKDCQTTLQ